MGTQGRGAVGSLHWLVAIKVVHLTTLRVALVNDLGLRAT
jgi:hypothetical protein